MIVKKVEVFKEWERMKLYKFDDKVEMEGDEKLLERKKIEIIMEGNVKEMKWMKNVEKEEGI
jgi:hypothetical protein